ncbi:MAG: GGDEF domain-containing protein [Salaquimonas sp.]
MDTGTIYQFVTPIVSIIFAAAFFVIYFYSKKKLSIALFGVSYLLGGAVLILDILRSGFSEVTSSLMLNSLYLLTLAVLTAAFALHFEKKIPYKMMMLVATATLSIMLWYLLVDYNITMRTASMNFGSALILLPAIGIVPRKNCSVIYKAIFWALVITFAQFYIRTGLTIYLADQPLSMENYRNSIYLIGFHFSVALAAVGLALTLCIAIGIEEVTNMRRLAETDPLSGLVNRRGFEQEACSQIGLSNQRKVPLSLIVCDIDHFKNINDTYGHDVGDKIIKGFGRIIQSGCRRTDLVARIGGEEFCILLPVATKEMAFMVANSVREVFGKYQFPDLPEDAFCNASFGVSQIEPGENYQQLFKRADDALYQAKQTGRNKCIISPAQHEKPKGIGMNARNRRAQN